MTNNNNNLYKIKGIQEPEFELILSEITDEKFLKTILPFKIFARVNRLDISLNDILKFTSIDLIKLKIKGAAMVEYMNFKENIFAKKNEIINYHFSHVYTHQIPFKFETACNMLQNFESLIIDLIFLYDAKNDKKSIRNKKILEFYYGVNCPVLNRKEIMEKMEFESTQRVDQILMKEITLMQLFGEDCPIIEQKKLNIAFLSEINTIKNKCLWNTRIFEEFGHSRFENNQTELAKKIERYVELFNCKLVEIDNQNYLIEQSNKDSVSFFREHYRALTQLLNSEIEPLSLVEIIKKLEPEFKLKQKIDENIILQILNQDIYELIQKENMPTKYQIKFEYLSGQLYKTKRILFEEGFPLLKVEILEKFNDRSNVNLKEQDIHLKSDATMISLGNYKWEYRKSNNNIKREKSNKFINRFIIDKGGVATFNDIKEALLQKHYTISDNSTRTYITDCSRVSKSNNNLFVHKEFVKNYPEIELENEVQRKIGFQNTGDFIIQSIGSVFENDHILDKTKFKEKILEKCHAVGYKIPNKQIIDFHLKKLIDSGIVLEINNKYVFDSTEFAKNDRIIYRKEPKYISTIRSIAISELKHKTNFQISLVELWKLCKTYYPIGIKKTNFYKIFQDSSLFEKSIKDKKLYVSLCINHLPDPKVYSESVDEEIVKTGMVNENSNLQVDSFYRPKFDKTEMNKHLVRELKTNYDLEEKIIEIGMTKFYKALEVEGKLTRWGESLLQSIFELWFFKTDVYDREHCLIKLTTNYETFIKNLDKSPSEFSGLSELIKTNRKLYSLRCYSTECKQLNKTNIDYTRKKFSNAMKSLIYFRNLFSHDTSHIDLDLSISHQISYISQFISLYIYSAYLLED